MSDIQRWDREGRPNPDGVYVTYADHVAAVAEAEQNGRLAQSAVEMDTAVINQNTAYQKGYEQGQRDERERWEAGGPWFRISKVEAYEKGVIAGAAEGVRSGRSGAISDAVAAVEALHRTTIDARGFSYETVVLAQVIAAIKGVSDEA
jgi:flagellar biosynthesis/type III secretory pathway protein FliH